MDIKPKFGKLFWRDSLLLVPLRGWLWKTWVMEIGNRHVMRAKFAVLKKDYPACLFAFNPHIVIIIPHEIEF